MKAQRVAWSASPRFAPILATVVAVACAVGPTRTGLSAEEVRDLVPAASAIRMETLDDELRVPNFIVCVLDGPRA